MTELETEVLPVQIGYHVCFSERNFTTGALEGAFRAS